MAYGGSRHDQVGSLIVHRCTAAIRINATTTKEKWPTSTPETVYSGRREVALVKTSIRSLADCNPLSLLTVAWPTIPSSIAETYKDYLHDSLRQGPHCIFLISTYAKERIDESFKITTGAAKKIEVVRPSSV
jgi:hypothetical protein